MNALEKRLFDEIQYLVEELPWTNELNLDYFETCVHEAGHGAVQLVVYKDFKNPCCLSKLTLVATVKGAMRGFRGKAMASTTIDWYSGKYLFPIIPMFLYKLTGVSGAILTDEFFNYFYGWGKVKDLNELQKTYGADSDFAKILPFGTVGVNLAKTLVRFSYSKSDVRILHLRLIRDLLKNNGKFVIKNPEEYVKKKEL